MSEKKSEWIEEILKNAKGQPLLTNEIVKELERKYGCDTTSETARRDLKHLKKLRICCAVLHPEKLKNAWIHTDYKKLGYQEISGLPHTQKIKDRVITPWIGQLPKINNRGVFHPKRKFLRERKIFRGKDAVLPIENKMLFQDFKNHVKPSFGDPFKILDGFKDLVKDFWKTKEDFLREIKKVVEEKIRLSISKRVEKGEEGIHPNFVEYIYEAACYLAEGDEKMFNSFINPSHPPFQVEKHGDRYQFKRGVDLFGIRDARKEKEFEERIIGSIKEIGEEIKRDKYKGKAGGIIQIIQNLKTSREKMVSTLEKHYHLPLLPGDCEYLS